VSSTPSSAGAIQEQARPAPSVLDLTEVPCAVGTILAYIFYWLAVIVALVFIKWQEVSSLWRETRNTNYFGQGRVTIFGKESKIGRERRARREAKAARLAAGPHSPVSESSKDSVH
jgi:hypothetical protein